MIYEVLASFILIQGKPFIRFDDVPREQCEMAVLALTKENKDGKLPIRYMCMEGAHWLESPNDDWITATMSNLNQGFIPIMVVGMTEDRKGKMSAEYFYHLGTCQKKHTLCAYTTQRLQWSYKV